MRFCFLNTDIAVAAPFEDNGAVYIYHGSVNGLIAKASQRLVAPRNDLTEPFTVHMFGHGLSRGVDVDGNNFNGKNRSILYKFLVHPQNTSNWFNLLYVDLAIGAPNAERVYVYKSYPVVRLNVSVTPISKELKTTDSSMKLVACWSYSSPHPIDFPIGNLYAWWHYYLSLSHIKSKFHSLTIHPFIL